MTNEEEYNALRICVQAAFADNRGVPLRSNTIRNAEILVINEAFVKALKAKLLYDKQNKYSEFTHRHVVLEGRASGLLWIYVAGQRVYQASGWLDGSPKDLTGSRCFLPGIWWDKDIPAALAALTALVIGDAEFKKRRGKQALEEEQAALALLSRR